jgi:tetratricopeptide (TPR) repeat protein
MKRLIILGSSIFAVGWLLAGELGDFGQGLFENCLQAAERARPVTHPHQGYPPGYKHPWRKSGIYLGGAYRNPYAYYSYYRGWGYYPPPYYYPYAYPYYYRRPVILPPVVIPAGTLYGPQAVQRFMGVANRPSPPRDVNIIAGPPRDRNRAAPPAKKDLPQRGAHPQALARAWKFIGFGDAHFGNQKYAQALERYRKAARAAPQLADAYFRQGLVQTALGRYAAAVKAIRRGLALEPKWPQSGFQLDELYDENAAAKDAHLEVLAKAAAENPQDADLLFLVGVYLHFDRQAERAAPFFQRAAQLAGAEAGHIRAFLGKENP